MYKNILKKLNAKYFLNKVFLIHLLGHWRRFNLSLLRVLAGTSSVDKLPALF